MTDDFLVRRAPHPLPTVHPVPEYRVDGQRRRLYDEMKAALQVPWMGVVTMAYAHYPTFFATLWEGIRPLVTGPSFLRHSHELRAMVEQQVQALAPPPLRPSLQALGYAPRELDELQQTLEVFSHGNFPYLIIATLVRVLLAGADMEGVAAEERRSFDAAPTPLHSASLVLMEAHHADAPTRAIYDDVKHTLGLPFVNTDYRAMARWPSYFALAWSGLKPVVTGQSHARICDLVHGDVMDRVRRHLPNPAGLSARALRAAAQTDAPLEEVCRMAELFQWLLPGLVTNVAFFRAQLLEGAGA